MWAWLLAIISHSVAGALHADPSALGAFPPLPLQKKAGDCKALKQKRLQYRKDKEAVEAQRKVSKASFSNDTIFTTQSSKLLGALGAVFKQPPDDLDPSASLAQIKLILRTAELERRILQSTLGSICEQVTGCRVSLPNMGGMVLVIFTVRTINAC